MRSLENSRCTEAKFEKSDFFFIIYYSLAVIDHRRGTYKVLHLSGTCFIQPTSPSRRTYGRRSSSHQIRRGLRYFLIKRQPGIKNIIKQSLDQTSPMTAAITGSSVTKTKKIAYSLFIINP